MLKEQTKISCLIIACNGLPNRNRFQLLHRPSGSERKLYCHQYESYEYYQAAETLTRFVYKQLTSIFTVNKTLEPVAVEEFSRKDWIWNPCKRPYYSSVEG